MQLSDIERTEAVVALFEVFWRLATCAHHHINSYETVRDDLPNALNFVGEEVAAVMAAQVAMAAQQNKRVLKR